MNSTHFPSDFKNNCLSYSPVRISWSSKMEFKGSFIYIFIIVTEVDHIMCLLNFLVCTVWIYSVPKTHLLKAWPPAHGEVVELLELRGRKPGHWGCVNEEILALQPFLFPPPLLWHHHALSRAPASMNHLLKDPKALLKSSGRTAWYHCSHELKTNLSSFQADWSQVCVGDEKLLNTCHSPSSLLRICLFLADLGDLSGIRQITPSALYELQVLSPFDLRRWL